jgi:uncharacterized protein
VFKPEIAAPSAARCRADLAWLLQSPPLLSLVPQRFSAAVQAFDAEQSQAITAWLAQLDAQHLQADVAQALPTKAPLRLGRYAERLMAYFLRESKQFELIAANLPLRRAVHQIDGTAYVAGTDHTAGTDHIKPFVNKQHTTIGEFDYLLHDTAGTHWHWELAVKFYLYHASTNTAPQAHDFKGPAGKDTLGLKLGKVFDKQLMHLPPAPYDTVHWQPAAYARGWLFYPHGVANALCDVLNPQHLRGWWLTIAGFESTVFDSAYFVHLPRLHWLAPYCLDELPVASQAEMAAQLKALWQSADSKQASAGQLIACVVQNKGVWQEVSRGFVRPIEFEGAPNTVTH